MPNRSPLLVLPSHVLFPRAELTLTFVRPEPIAAITEAQRRGCELVVVLQRESTGDSPRPSDLFEVGTLASLVEAQHGPGGLQVRLAGLRRVRRVRSDLELDEPTSSTEWIPLDDLAPRADLAPVVGALQATLVRAAAMKRYITREAASQLAALSDPGQLADALAAAVDETTGDPADAQEVLEALDVGERLARLASYLDGEDGLAVMSAVVFEHGDRREQAIAAEYEPAADTPLAAADSPSGPLLRWVERFYGPRRGLRASAVEAAEASLGCALPPLLRDVYLGTGAMQEVWDGREVGGWQVCGAKGLTWSDGKLVFATDSQATWEIAIAPNGEGPVQFQGGYGWLPAEEDLGSFLGKVVLLHRVSYDGEVVDAERLDAFLDDWELHALRTPLANVDLYVHGRTVLRVDWPHDDDDDDDFDLEDDDDDASPEVFVGGADPAEVARHRAALGLGRMPVNADEADEADA